MYFSAIINKLKTFFSPKKLHVLSMPAYMNLHSSLDFDSNVRGLLPHQIPFEIEFYEKNMYKLKSKAQTVFPRPL